ncbi:MAG: YabP/YqfC family sporulation protein [Clostridia bacterium]|jgi:sporulation protein YabP|nr:YabP/YqfC family sporulation protein [Clostridia bacterium]
MPQYLSNEANNASHKITLTHRCALEIEGAGDVLSFDENSVVLKTSCGLLTIDGENLHIIELGGKNSGGQLRIEGNIAGIFYVDDDEREKKGLFGRSKR